MAENGFPVSVLPAAKEGPAAQTIQLRSLATRQLYGLNFWPKGSSRVWIDGVSVIPSGDVIVVGPLARGVSIQNFVYELDRYGNVMATFDPGSHEPERACSTGDGTIWTFGQDWDAEEAGTPYPVLRSYSLNGQVLRSVLPRSQLSVFGLNTSDRLRTLAGPGAGGAACRGARPPLRPETFEAAGPAMRCRIPARGPRARGSRVRRAGRRGRRLGGANRPRVATRSGVGGEILGRARCPG